MSHSLSPPSRPSSSLISTYPNIQSSHSSRSANSAYIPEGYASIASRARQNLYRIRIKRMGSEDESHAETKRIPAENHIREHQTSDIIPIRTENIEGSTDRSPVRMATVQRVFRKRTPQKTSVAVKQPSTPVLSTSSSTGSSDRKRKTPPSIKSTIASLRHKKRLSLPSAQQPSTPPSSQNMMDEDPNNYRLSSNSAFGFMERKAEDETQRMFQEWQRNGCILPCPVEIEDKVEAWFLGRMEGKRHTAEPALRSPIPERDIPTSIMDPRRNPALLDSHVIEQREVIIRTTSRHVKRKPTSIHIATSTPILPHQHESRWLPPAHSQTEFHDDSSDEDLSMYDLQEVLEKYHKKSDTNSIRQPSKRKVTTSGSAHNDPIILVHEQIPEALVPQAPNRQVEANLNRLPPNFNQDDMSYENLLQLDAFITRSGRGLCGDDFRKHVQWIKLRAPHHKQFTCSICLEELSQDREIGLLKHCRHLFDMCCISKHFETSKLCPLCRHDYGQ